MRAPHAQPTAGPAAAIEFLREAALLHRQGNLARAAACCAQAVAADPRNFDALHFLGVLRAQQGQLAEAATLLQRAINREPRSAPAHNNLGMTLNLWGHHADAVAPLERAIALDPNNPLAHNNLGNSLRALGRPAEAAACFERAAGLKPDYVEAHSNLGGVLHELGRDEEAVERLEKALALKPDFVEARLNLGIALHALDRREAAAACFGRVLASAPRNVSAHRHLGGLDLEAGRIAEARRSYERALEIEPENAGVLYDIMQCGAVAPDDPHLATLQALSMRAAALPEEDRIRIHFALGKACADLGDNEAGFGQLRAGNALKRRRMAYDEIAELGLFARIRNVFSAELLRSRAQLGNPSDRPIFILGMMRSGSTLVEQMLASHPAVFAAGERPDFNEAYKTVRRTLASPEAYPETVPLMSAAQLRALGEGYLARIGAVAGGAAADRITDKMPGNFSAVGLIHLALPKARIIHTVRDPIDTCLSCFSILFNENQPFAYDLGELGRYYRAYARLMEHWRAALPVGAMLDVRYEELVGDFERQARRILDYCGLEWNDACLNFYDTDRPVRTASQVQVRRPLYQSSIGRWRPGDETLRPLLDGLAGVAAAIT